MTLSVFLCQARLFISQPKLAVVLFHLASAMAFEGALGISTSCTLLELAAGLLGKGLRQPPLWDRMLRKTISWLDVHA